MYLLPLLETTQQKLFLTCYKVQQRFYSLNESGSMVFGLKKGSVPCLNVLCVIDQLIHNLDETKFSFTHGATP
jgi:hypothetical protein